MPKMKDGDLLYKDYVNHADQLVTTQPRLFQMPSALTGMKSMRCLIFLMHCMDRTGQTSPSKHGKFVSG